MKKNENGLQQNQVGNVAKIVGSIRKWRSKQLNQIVPVPQKIINNIFLLFCYRHETLTLFLELFQPNLRNRNAQQKPSLHVLWHATKRWQKIHEIRVELVQKLYLFSYRKMSDDKTNGSFSFFSAVYVCSCSFTSIRLSEQ